MKKFLAVILCVAMLFSVCATGFATEAKNVVTVSCEEDLKNLDRDIPIVYVTGLEHEYYKGLSTETEEDDELDLLDTETHLNGEYDKLNCSLRRLST